MKGPAGRSDKGNFVGEWFGHIVWPPNEVDDSESAVFHQVNELCPFLSDATGKATKCTKPATRVDDGVLSGFCSQSGRSNGRRQDWLACPNRVFDANHTIIGQAVRLLYSVATGDAITVDPVTKFSDPSFRDTRVRQLLNREARVFAFSSNPSLLGGEISIPESEVASSSKVDVSIVELILPMPGGPWTTGQSAIFELQTADFHGSPSHAISELRQLGPPTVTVAYHRAIRANPSLLGKKVEGPNKANVFKRMIYQMLVKMQMATVAPECAGCCVVIPLAVWDSWARHLGAPELIPATDRENWTTLRDSLDSPTSCWILVIDIDRQSTLSPRPLKVVLTVETDPATLARYAFLVAPRRGVAQGAMRAFHDGISKRLGLSLSGRQLPLIMPSDDE